MATYTINVTSTPVSSGILKIGSEGVDGAQGTVQEEGVTVNVLATALSGFTFVELKLDAVTVSTSPVYSFVMPASDVALEAIFEEIIAPPEESTNLYDSSCPKFYFIQDLPSRIFVGDLVDLTPYLTTEIEEEPIGFDNATFELIRDKDYHGFNYDLTLDTISFERGQGYEYLFDKFLTLGTDANIKFVFGYGNTDALVVVYIGRLDFNELEQNNAETISINIVNDDFGSLLNTAFDIPQIADVNGSTLLKSRAIPKRVQYLFPFPEYVTGTAIPVFDPILTAFFAEYFRTGAIPQIKATDDVGYLYFNDGRGGDSDFNTFITYDFQVDNSNPFINPNDSQKYLFKVAEAGNYKIDVKLKLGINTSGVIWADYVNPFKLVHFITSNDGETIIGGGTLDPIASVSDGLLFDKILNYTTTIEAELGKNQVVYLYIQVDTSVFPVGGVVNFIYGRAYDFDVRIPQIDIVGSTVVEDSICPTETAFSTLNQIFKSASGVDYDLLSSDLFGVGGCYNELALTNGFNVRGGSLAGANLEQLKIKMSPKKLFEGLSSILNLGWGVEYNDLRQELIRVESTEYFYQNVEIALFEEELVSNFKLSVDAPSYYNEIEIGYSKYSKTRDTDKQGTLDDVHTKHTYQTPVKTNKSKKSIISDIIMSSYELEITRRKQYERTSGSSNSNYNTDQDVFGIMLTSEEVSEPLAEAVIPNLLLVEESAFITRGQNGTNPIVQMTNIPFTVGEAVTYIGSDGTIQSRTVSFYNVESELVFDILIGNFVIIFGVTIGFAEAYIGTSGAAQVIIRKTGTASVYSVPESIQPFSSVINLLSPSTSYNLRFTPKRMLLNWGNILNGGFRALADRIIKFKEGDGNIECQTQLSDTETCLQGDIDRQLVVEGSDLDLSVGTWGDTYLFLPINVEFSYPLLFDVLSMLRKAMRGQLVTGNYGYISVPFCGSVYKIFIDKISFNPTEDEAKIKGKLKEI